MFLIYIKHKNVLSNSLLLFFLDYYLSWIIKLFLKSYHSGCVLYIRLFDLRKRNPCCLLLRKYFFAFLFNYIITRWISALARVKNFTLQYFLWWVLVIGLYIVCILKVLIIYQYLFKINARHPWIKIYQVIVKHSIL